MNKVVGFLWTLLFVILFVGDQIPFLLAFALIVSVVIPAIIYHYRPEWLYMDKDLAREIKKERLEREAEKKEAINIKENKESDAHLDKNQ
jgi:hypothetical protein